MAEEDLRIILSTNIKRYRNLRNFTQTEFADRISISVPFLSDIENGKKWVSSGTLVKIANVLKIEVYELFKPDKILPDKAVDILKKFSTDIHVEFGKSLEDLCSNYTKKLEKNKGNL